LLSVHAIVRLILTFYVLVSESSQKDFYKARNNQEEFTKKAKSLEGGYSSIRGGQVINPTAQSTNSSLAENSSNAGYSEAQFNNSKGHIPDFGRKCKFTF
jgi:hypothetical protein